MGLWSFLGVGRKKKNTITVDSVVIGEDRNLNFRELESTGIDIRDHNNRLAYDSYPQAIGSHIVYKKGIAKILGQVCVLFEPMSRPWSFPDAKWVPAPKNDKDSANKRTIVLSDARSEGFSMAIQRKDDEESSERMQTILILLVGLFAIVILGFLVQSGFLKDIHLFPGG